MKILKYTTFRKCYLITFLCCMLLSTLSANESEKAAKSMTLRIVVHDTSMLKNASLQIKLFEDGINTDFNMQTKQLIYDINSEITEIKILLQNDVTYCRMIYDYTNQPRSHAKRLLNANNNLFILESADNISMTLHSDGIEFSGKGSEKYSCVYELAKHTYILDSQVSFGNSLLKKGDYDSYFNQAKRSQDSLYKVRKEIITSFHNLINPRVFDLIDTDCWAEYQSKLEGAIFQNTSRFTKGLGALHLEAVKTAYFKYLSNYNEHFKPDSILETSLKYCDFLYWKEYHAEQVFNRQNTDLSPFAFRYSMINNKYTGALRDKLIYMNFLRGEVNDADRNTYSQKAIESISKALYKDALIKNLDNKKGVAYHFALPDAKGKIHRLKDYFGKLIIIDFWYTGCGNCAIQAKSLKPLIEHYKTNPNIQFISISIDGYKNKDLWIKSLNSKIYTDDSEVNLLTDGKNSEIIKHYNITGYPRLIVIGKDGRMITTSPPNPRTKIVDFEKLIADNI